MASFEVHLKFATVRPHAMQDHRELVSNRDFGFAEPASFGDPHAPGFEHGPFFNACQRNACRLKEIASQHLIGCVHCRRRRLPRLWRPAALSPSRSSVGDDQVLTRFALSCWKHAPQPARWSSRRASVSKPGCLNVMRTDAAPGGSLGAELRALREPPASKIGRERGQTETNCP
jgi:hypothetical protein